MPLQESTPVPAAASEAMNNNNNNTDELTPCGEHEDEGGAVKRAAAPAHDQDSSDRASSPPAHRPDDSRLGHSRIATTALDCDIPTKRPRLSPLETPTTPTRPHFASPPLQRNNSNDELSPTATAARLFHSPQPPPPSQGMVIIEQPSLGLHCFSQLDDDNNALCNDDNSSCGWSLRPLAPSAAILPCFAAAAAVQQRKCGGHNSDGSITSYSSNSSTYHHANNTDRWRSNQPMSSFSSTLTERSTTGSGETEDSPSNCMEEAEGTTTTMLSKQQAAATAAAQLLEYNEEGALSHKTTNIASSSSKRKSQNPIQQQTIANSAATSTTETVDQLTTRLDHWCSITNMRALKRRNNIYADDRHKSSHYNPHQEYDYSHYQLSRHIRKLQCKSAKQQVMRALKGREEDSDLFGDENNPSPSNLSLSNTHISNNSNNHSRDSPPATVPCINGSRAYFNSLKDSAPPTPTTSNTSAKCARNTMNDNHHPGSNHGATNAATNAMDVIMGENC